MTSDAAQTSDSLPQLTDPLMVMALTGWIDAGGAAAAALEAIVAECNAEVIATFVSDEYIDYRARRPSLVLDEGVHASILWQDIQVLAGATPDGRDIVLLRGPEPDMKWRRFAQVITELAQALGVVRLVGLGAYPFTSPHTRPPRISVTAPTKAAIAALPYLRSSLEVPGGAAAVVAQSFADAGIPAVALWAQIPHYASAMPYPDGAVALVDALRDLTGVELAIEALRAEAVVQRQRLDALVAENAEHATMVRQMEVAHDAAGEATPTSFEIPTGDQLAAEVERFLRDQ